MTGRHVVGRRHFGGVLEAVALVEHIEELGVGVLVLLARVWVGHVHGGRDAVGHHPARATVLGPPGYGIVQVLPEDPVEVGGLPGLIEVPEQVVERSVLEEDQDHMVHRMCWLVRHQSLSITSAQS